MDSFFGVADSSNFNSSLDSVQIRPNNSQPNWAVLILIIFIILAVVGNTFVCLAITTERRLQNVTNYFLFSLAVTDLMVSTLVMPFSILVEFDEGRWRLGFTMCAVYCYSDVFLCSASIVHMTCISLDRYLGISRPLKTRNKSTLIVALKIIIVWLITIIISCPLAVLTLMNPAEIYTNNVCAIVNRYFMIYGSTLAFIIPCLIMLITYLRTTHLLKQQTMLCLSSTAGLRRTIKRPLNKSRRQSSVLTLQDSDESNNGCTSRSPSENRNRKCSAPPRLKTSISEKGFGQDCYLDNYVEERSNLPPPATLREKFREKTGVLLQKARNSSAAADLANEQKATRVLGLVFACFFICWTPFFALNFTNAFCGDYCRAVPRSLESTFLWLGYLSSMINPIIYTTFNRRFRRAFLNIISCKICRYGVKRRRSNQSISYSYTMNGPTVTGGVLNNKGDSLLFTSTYIDSSAND